MMMRAVTLVVVMLLTGCSFAGAGPVPSVSAVNVSQPSTLHIALSESHCSAVW